MLDWVIVSSDGFVELRWDVWPCRCREHSNTWFGVFEMGLEIFKTSMEIFGVSVLSMVLTLILETVGDLEMF